MPDFERPLRQLAVENSPHPEITRAFHKGEDHARKQVAVTAIIILAFACLITYFGS